MWKFARLSVLALAACGPTLPESGATLDGRPVDYGRGVGFGSYESYEAARIARERELSGADRPQASVAPTQPVISSEELRAAGLPSGQGGALPSAEPIGAGAPLSASRTAAASSANAGQPAGTVPVTPTNNPGISDEQSFDAVTARETIESDAERLARQRAAYRVIPPTAVPQRDGGNDGPNIVAYALNTSNARGQPIYRRTGIALQSRSARACQGYASPDLAQEAFLEAGGPERDRLNLDPDGDGFACAWDPAPFRRARG
ncbi:hypothetical protein SAMN04488012_10451 [Palleronia salina]|uniref:Excalibur calcium-binding domain-containing protein n=1 Tax=Palleronia salina TaxID=313368 RepID=A0A1M6FRT3_9RHOB|nr:hypothetical protein [Palleronia salina]SHJ00402.1 hypothetical protein SAMN04488012_10451 [Palleronia salina]